MNPLKNNIWQTLSQCSFCSFRVSTKAKSQLSLRKYVFNEFNSHHSKSLLKLPILSALYGLSNPVFTTQVNIGLLPVLQVNPKPSWPGNLPMSTHQRDGGDVVISNRPHRFSWFTATEGFMKCRYHPFLNLQTHKLRKGFVKEFKQFTN